MRGLFLSVVLATVTSVFASPEPLAERADGSTFIPIKAPRTNVFKQLSSEEHHQVTKFLKQQGLTGRHASIDHIALLPPNKTDALAYLDGSGPKPKRWAEVGLYTYFGHKDYIKEYQVGPLPVGHGTKAFPLDYIFGGNGTMRVSNNDRETSRDGVRHHEPSSGLPGPGERNGWSGVKLEHDNLVAPVPIVPSGARYSFDPAESYVEWMDFSFYFSYRYTGLLLHDIRFKGKRVVYELGMQEALAHYAGVNEDVSERAYLDSLYGFTKEKMVPGYDCPYYSTFRDGFCLFEFENSYPIQRHTGGHISVTKNLMFVLRSTSTIGNYDYQFSYEFYLDGSIQILARASGYIAGTGWGNNPANPEYGYHIRDHLSGAMHDHVLNFKLDLDIHGTANSMMRTEFVPVTTTYPWSHGKERNTMKITRSFIESENDGKLNWAPNAAAVFSVVNKDTPNQWGEYPGYKIYQSTGASIHSTIENSTVLANTINWATHPLYVLKRKDSEPMSAYVDNRENVHNPMVDFNDFFNGESLDQTDLVVYFNLGMHHLPDTSDLPNTVFTSAQSGITIRPINYLDSDASRDTRQQVRVERGRNVKVNTYGASMPSGNFDLDSTNPNLQAYFGHHGN